jgi:UDP-N-acetylglucosamine 4-epimerase
MKEKKGSRILLTGGAGFIGSNLTASLLNNPQVSQLTVLDNLATGFERNIEEFKSNEKFKFVIGDIRDSVLCENLTKGIDAICHQAALGSVPRSIADPITSHDVNVNGFLNILNAAKSNGVKRIVYASSSSVYGDLNESPKVESRVGKILSPYAATKMTNELYAEAFAKAYGMTIVGLRYFNVFGPKQDPNGAYAAVVPLFIKAGLTNTPPTINGDGTITRDFTPIENVVQINTKALLSETLESAKHYVFNVACGQTTDLNTLWELVKTATNANVNPHYGPNRPGDIFFSLADVSYAMEQLNYIPNTNLKLAIEQAVIDYKLRYAF